MNSIALWAYATAITLGTAFCPQISSAEEFTGEAFLAWGEAEQRGYLDAQIVMASSIVSRSKPTLSDCIADQFYGPNGLTDSAFVHLLTTIEQYSSYHPSSVLVVVIENNCGTFY